MTTMPEPLTSVPMPAFTDEQVDALVDFLKVAGKNRAAEQGADFSEPDYLAAVGAVLFTLGRESLVLSWFFDFIAGKSPLDLPKLDQTVYVVHDPKNRRNPTTLYRHKAEADEHVAFLADHGNNDVYRTDEPVRHALRPEVAKAIEAENDWIEAEERAGRRTS